MKNFIQIKANAVGQQLSFESIDLVCILGAFKEIWDVNNFTWAIHDLYATGDIREILGINVTDLERKCKESAKGFEIDFFKLIMMLKECTDIIDILITARSNFDKIPDKPDFNEFGDLYSFVFSKEDSSIWEFSAKTSENFNLLKKFCLVRCMGKGSEVPGDWQ